MKTSLFFVFPSKESLFPIDLQTKTKQLEKDFQGKEILRPDFWGGFLVKPVEVEFWQGRPNRLHDRIRYQLQDDFSWKIERLAP